MKKHPILLALALLAGIFIFFLLLAIAVANMLGQPTQFAIGEKIGVVEVFGVITDSKQTIKQLHDFRDNDAVKAIVLRVDSPGGGVGPSQEIHDEIRRITELKPIVVSMGSVAASGGYYISAPASVIFANPGTITGSIGVIMQFANVQDLLEKIGLSNEVVKSGPHKDIGSPTRPMTDSDRTILQSMVDDVHSQFIEAVSAGRGLDENVVRKLADGRIFSGRQAQQYGLVDELGSLEAAIRKAAELAGIEGEPDVVYPPGPKPRLIDFFVEESIARIQSALQKPRFVGMQYLWEGFN